MSSRELVNLSDLFFAIGDTIIAAGLGVQVGNYNDFSGKVSDATVLIEIERTTPARRGTDGRKGHRVTVTLHAVVARWRQHCELEATNLATCLERLATDNRWGLPGRQCGLPEDQGSGPSFFEKGANGYSAWATSFVQWISIGPELLEDPTVSGAPLVAYSWQVTDFSDAAQYEQLEVTDQ